MRDISELTDQSPVNAQEQRTIALGIVDFRQRKAVLAFIDDYERLARALKARDVGVCWPTPVFKSSDIH
jgi:hypothetical protein